MLGSSPSLSDCHQVQRLSYRAYSKESAINTAGCIHIPHAVGANGCFIAGHPFGYNRGEIKKMATSYCFFSMEWIPSVRPSRSGVGVGVVVDIFRPESESESLKICRLRNLGLQAWKLPMLRLWYTLFDFQWQGTKLYHDNTLTKVI